MNYTYHCKNVAATVAVINFFKSINWSVSSESPVEKYAKNLIAEYPLMQISTCKKHIGGNYTDYGYDRLSLEEIFEKFSVAMEKTVKLNSEYSAIVQKDGSFKVGCQTFTKKHLDDINAAIVELNS